MTIKPGTGRRKLEYRLNCACGLVTAWRVERKRIPDDCRARGTDRLSHVAIVEKRITFV